ncbi:ATP-binding protein [Mucilaginibacter celer]|uniref:histidine kinase n=1 Tax=Mucilaginibacter celer TaxID=2305508 RepID=A0A494VVD7_9SPHI|nr:ATP-binding protein [Mucilaginibacter celer]AYL95403.1 GHKL domain-containing protein [Mucilaginibacter celer]
MIKVTTGSLQVIDALKDVPADQLEWLLSNSYEQFLPAGELLFEPGTPINFTYIFISGKVSLYVLRNNEAREFALAEASAIHGYLPFSRGKINFAYGRALEDTRLLLFPAALMNEMICNHFELTQALVHVMSSRVRDLATRQQQDEKMMALGKLSAGLAHELNNPATAIMRGGAIMKEHLQSIRLTFYEILKDKVSPEMVEIVKALLSCIQNEKQRPTPGMMERSSREQELTGWLQKWNITAAGDIADDLITFGLNISDAEKFLNCIPEPWASQGMNWLRDNLVMERVVRDIEESSRRITDLVGSVKTFTHMDQGRDKEYADIHDGIRNTLVMLQYKFRNNNVRIVEKFDAALPPVKAMIGELNQVWTNLIDNALDAMERTPGGVLELSTRSDGLSVFVTIADNGPGIPEDIVSSVFDPFFTTKAIGKGTGLGLDVVLRIVRQHRGTVKLASVPGRTEFVVCFPING